jgi:CelD/BcsL family acetyltransferase involved in cellulose biosynthesis
MQYKLKVISKDDEFRALAPQWNDLLDRSPSDSIYLTWEWLFTWWETFGGPGRQPHIITIHDASSRLVGILPLIITEKVECQIIRLKVLEFLGTGEAENDEVCSNYLDLITDQPPADIWACLLDYIEQGFNDKRWDCVSLRAVPWESIEKISLTSTAGYRFSIEENTPSAVVDLSEGWENYLAGLQKKRRSQIRRGRKDLELKGKVDFTVVDSPDRIPGAYRKFVDLHQARWESTGGRGLFSSPVFAEFHEKIIARMGGKNNIEVNLLTCGGQLLAATYKYRYKKRVYRYLSAYDPEFDSKIGLGLIERTYDIERAINRGYSYMDFFRAGPDSYKWHIAKGRRRVGTISICREGIKRHLLKSIALLKAGARGIRKICPGKIKS